MQMGIYCEKVRKMWADYFEQVQNVEDARDENKYVVGNFRMPAVE